MKTAHITPIIKKQHIDKAHSSYRPSYITTTYSCWDIWKNCCWSTHISYEIQYDIWKISLSAYISHRSTKTPLLNIFDAINGSINNNNNNVLLTLLLSFDMLDHELLVQRLYNIGIRGSVLAWFKSYITERTQCVQLTHWKPK